MTNLVYNDYPTRVSIKTVVTGQGYLAARVITENKGSVSTFYFLLERT